MDAPPPVIVTFTRSGSVPSTAVVAPIKFNFLVLAKTVVPPAPAETSRGYVSPLVPEVPSSPEVPEVPLVPFSPEVPDVPEVPEVPDVPGSPVLPIPFVPLIPEVPDVPEVPEVPDVPGFPCPPLVPDVPLVLDAPPPYDPVVKNSPAGEITIVLYPVCDGDVPIRLLKIEPVTIKEPDTVISYSSTPVKAFTD